MESRPAGVQFILDEIEELPRLQSCQQSFIIFLCEFLYQNGFLRIVLLEQDDSSENLLLKHYTGDTQHESK